MSIRFATLDDVDNIMAFIHHHWKLNHILSRNKQLFLYEYQDGQRINFVISKDESGKINGILGFIKASNVKSDIWAAMWKSLKCESRPMLGIEILEYLRNSSAYGTLLCLGINEKTIGIYKYLGIFTDHMKHFVLLNNKLPKLHIARVKTDIHPYASVRQENFGCSFKKITKNELSFCFEKHKDVIPYKDNYYFIKRYFQHPIYTYNVYGIYIKNEPEALLVIRQVSANGAKALRLVDYIGDEKHLLNVATTLRKFVIQNGYEYLDFVCYGFDSELLNRAGFLEVNFESDDLIVPDHFSPFERKNHKIIFFIDTDRIDKVRMCKADGDQDRPSSEHPI